MPIVLKVRLKAARTAPWYHAERDRFYRHPSPRTCPVDLWQLFQWGTIDGEAAEFPGIVKDCRTCPDLTATAIRLDYNYRPGCKADIGVTIEGKVDRG